MKKAIGCLFAFTALVSSGISFSGVRKVTAEELPEEELYFAPAGITAPYSYSNNPTSEPKYSGTVSYKNTNDPNNKYYSFAGKDTPFGRMNVASTWNSYRGESVKVAVIDTGCYYSHEEFANTTFVDCKNFYTGSAGLSYVNDGNGHGTTSAAMIAASINNKGSVGIAPNVELVILKCTNDAGSFSNSAVLDALQYCIDYDVDIINMSIQGYSSSFSATYTEDFGEVSVSTTSTGIMSSTYCKEKIDECYAAGITVVAAAGNYNTSTPSYPAANDHVIAVASTGLTEANKYNKAGYSNYGSWVDISAPGYVYTPLKSGTSDYSVNYGTSFSAPLVTGAIALFKSKYPYANPDQIEKALKETAYSIDWQGGAGAINVGSFLNYVPLESIALSETEKTLTVGDTYNITPTFSPSTATNKNVSYESSDPDICSVNSSGVITAVSTGNSIISVTSNETGKIYELIEVNVEESQSALEVYKTVTFTSSTMSEGTQAYTNVSFTNTCDGITTTVQNANNNQRGWDYIKFGSKSSATTGSLINTTAIDKAISQIDLTFTSVSNVSSAKLYVANNSTYTGATEISFTPTNGVTTIPISNPIQNGYYKIVFEMSQSSGNGPLVLTKIEYYTGSSSVTPSVKTLSSIAVTTSEHRTFTQGDSFVKETITATYSDTSTANVTNSATFSGYNMSNTGNQSVNVSYTEGGVTKSTSYSITVKAPAVTNYTVTFNSNGGSGSMSSQTTTGSSYTVPSCSFTRSNCSFSKWALNSASGTQYAVGQTITGISTNITLYAIWTANSATEISDDYGSYYPTSLDSLSGNSLLTALNTLNGQKRTRTIGYDNMRYKFQYVDLDWTDTTNMYGFYDNAVLSKTWDSGKTWNREHVWPKSLGGDQVEADMHMVRPASTSTNSDRGNDYFATSVFDPGTSDPYYRGIAARIIFYCAIADTDLDIIDANSGGDDQMGKLSDLLQWNLQYLPDKKSTAPLSLRVEQYRNKIIYSDSSLQGNRNPFIDHPEYACKIWGNKNSATKAICGLSGESLTLSQSSASLVSGNTLTLTATASGGSGSVGWSTSNSSVASLSATTGNSVTITAGNAGSATITATYGSVSKTCTITVTSSGGGDSSYALVEDISSLANGDKVYIATGLENSDNGITGWNNSKDATISTTKSDWAEYTVVISNNNYYLKDGDNYIAYTTSNEFKYNSSLSNAGAITLDSSNYVKAGGRYIAINGTNIRTYSSLTGYTGFYLYTLNSSSSTPTLSSISLNTDNVQKVFTVGDTFNSTGLVVTAHYSDETSAVINSGYTVTAPDMTSSGQKTVNVSYEGKDASYNITVNTSGTITYELEVDSSEVPFNSGTNHVASVGVKVYQYSNGVKGSVVSSGNVNVDTSSLGRKTVQYSYNNVQYSTSVKVTNHGADVGETTESHTETTYSDASVAHTFTANNMDGLPTGWTGTKSGTTNYEAARGLQLQKDASCTITTCSYTNIKSITVNLAKSNSGKGSFTVKIGSETYLTQTTFSTSSTGYTYNTASSPKTGVVTISGSATANSLYIKSITINYQTSSTTTIPGESHDATKLEQARAWATYFIEETRTEETCLASDDSQKLAGLQSKWEDLAYEYNEMIGDSKNEFCSSSDSTIVAARTHYLYIVSKFGASTLGDDGAFVKDSSNNTLQAKTNNALTLFGNDSSTALIVVLSFVSMLPIGMYFVMKKRKEQ